VRTGAPPAALHGVVAASLATMGLVVAAAIYLSDWEPR